MRKESNGARTIMNHPIRYAGFWDPSNSEHPILKVEANDRMRYDKDRVHERQTIGAL